MNIKDLPQGSYVPVGTTTPKLNLKDLPQDSYKFVESGVKPQSGYQGGNIAQDFAKAMVDPLTKIGSSVSKALLPKALEPAALKGTSVPSIFGGKDVNLVGYRDGKKLEGVDLAKDVAGTALEGASYLPITGGVSSVVKGVGGIGPRIGKLAKDFGIAGALQGSGSELQRGGSTGETITEGVKTGLASMVAGPVIGKGVEAAAKPIANAVKKVTDPVKFYTNQAKTNALKAVNVIGGVKPADMSKIKDKAYRALSVINSVAPDIKIRRGDELVPFDIKNTETPYLDTNDAIVEARKKVYEGIRGAYQEATGQKLTINPATILEDLRAIYNSPANAIEKRAKAQSLRDEIFGMTDINGNVPIENIETFTPQLNARAKPGFGNSSALGAQLDKDFSIKLSTLVDDAVEKIGIPQLRDLKDDYSALKAVEKFILNEAKKEARRLDTSIAANIGDVGSAEILSGIVNAFRAASGDAQAATSLARGVGLKVMSTMRKAAGDRANFLRNAFDDIDNIQRSLTQTNQTIKPMAKMPAIQGATAQSIKNSNSGTIPRSLPLTVNSASYTPEDMRLAEDFLNSQPNASIAADQAKAKELLSGLQAQLESLDAMDGMKTLSKFVGKRGEFKGELNLNSGKGKFASNPGIRLNEAVPGSDGQSAEEMANKYYSWVNAKQSIKENVDSLKKFLRQSPRGSVNFDAEIFPKKQATPVYKETGDLTTKILKSLEGKSTVSKQFILDATNRGELKQVERDLVRKMVEGEGNTVNVADFAKKVKAELLPLKVNKARDMYRSQMGSSGGRYENIALPDDLRGNVANYEERIYESPIKTSAGEVHFGQPKDKVEGYFGHTRIEDMADNSTRRVIEVQSDLYQKGGLDKENRYTPDYTFRKQVTESLSPEDKAKYEAAYNFVNSQGSNAPDSAKNFIERTEKAFIDTEKGKRAVELQKLSQYNDPTAHFRMIREEIKKAAEDGKTKLQFPTGETAMKIEGLGQNGTGFYNVNGSGFSTTYLQPSDLGVGKEIKTSVGNEKWIITDVLGDGKFKAVPKSDYDAVQKIIANGEEELAKQFSPNFTTDLSRYTEEFDISGKVDQNNPIYKFYNKEVRNYLNKFGGKEVKDDKGVSWVEIPIGKNSKGAVEAFGLLGAVGLGAAASGNKSASAMSTQDMPLLGSPQEDKQEAFMRPNEAYLRKPASTYSVRKNLSVSEDELKELAAVLFGEVGNRPLDKKLTELRAITNIALNRAEKEGKTLKEVLQSPNQFQAYLGKQYSAYKSGKASNSVLEREKIKAVETVVDEIRKGTLKNTVGDNLSYAHLKDDTLRVYKDWSEQKKDLHNIK